MKRLAIIGNVGNDAQIKKSNGREFVGFKVAVNERFKKADGTQVEETVWFDCVTGNTKLAPYIKKGLKVYITGNLSFSTYETKDRKHAVNISISVRELEFLSSAKKENGTNAAPDSVPEGVDPETGEIIDDLPFDTQPF